MRTTILINILQYMVQDNRIRVLVADMGFGAFDEIREQFPDRFMNVGISEQAMVGIAAGMAKKGLLPICYTMGNFAVHRAYEQWRNDVAMHSLPVLLLGMSTGFDNHTMGPTHHSVDDWGMLRGLPDTWVETVSSVERAAVVLNDYLGRSGFSYVRIPRGSPSIPESYLPLAQFYGPGLDAVVVTYGGMASAMRQVLKDDMDLVIVNQLSPLPKDLFDRICGYKNIIIVEDQFPANGLWASICELKATTGLEGSLHCRAPRQFYAVAGRSPEWFWLQFGGHPEQIVEDFAYGRNGRHEQGRQGIKAVAGTGPAEPGQEPHHPGDLRQALGTAGAEAGDGGEASGSEGR